MLKTLPFSCASCIIIIIVNLRRVCLHITPLCLLRNLISCLFLSNLPQPSQGFILLGSYPLSLKNYKKNVLVLQIIVQMLSHLDLSELLFQNICNCLNCDLQFHEGCYFYQLLVSGPVGLLQLLKLSFSHHMQMRIVVVFLN